MERAYGDLVRARRAILGISQRELAAQVGVTQPFIAGVEAGTRHPSGRTRQAVDAALALRPSQALAARRASVREAFARAGLPAPHVFGSTARGEDTASSDLDLVVEFTDRHDIVDLLALEHDLEELLTVPVDIVDARAAGPAGPATNRWLCDESWPRHELTRMRNLIAHHYDRVEDRLVFSALAHRVPEVLSTLSLDG